jgi:hypothetical protein
MKTTNQLKMDILSAKYFNRKHFPLGTRISWMLQGFKAQLELTVSKDSDWIA